MAMAVTRPEAEGTPEWLHSMEVAYQDLRDGIHNDATYVWTMCSIVTAIASGLFLGTGVAVLRISPPPSLVTQYGAGLIAMTLLWIWYGFLLLISQINSERYLVRVYIEQRLGIPMYAPAVVGSARYYPLSIPGVFHFVWTAYLLSITPPAPAPYPEYLCWVSLLVLSVGSLLYIGYQMARHDWRRKALGKLSEDLRKLRSPVLTLGDMREARY